MNMEKIHQFANEDTPSKVDVPNTFSGIVIWAAGRFGVSIIFAVAFAWAAKIVYDDNRILNERIITLLERRASVDTEMSRAFDGLTKAVAVLSEEAKRMHDRSELRNGKP